MYVTHSCLFSLFSCATHPLIPIDKTPELAEEILLVFEFHSWREIVSRFIYCVIANPAFIYYFDFIIYCVRNSLMM